MHARWAKLEKVHHVVIGNMIHWATPNSRILSAMMANLTSARSQTFMTVSNMTCYTTGIVCSHCSSSCTVMILVVILVSR